MGNGDKTIFAPATLVGESGITVIRISGSDAFETVSKIFSLSSKKFEASNISCFENHSAHHGYIFDEHGMVDEAVVSVYKTPNSYTGEDVVELSTHGGSYIFRNISSLLTKIGLAHAEPGEFSRRAFLNGKMDLVQAEAVADLIRARTDKSNMLALKQLSGEFSTGINRLRDEIINYCSLLELEMDFAEEGIDLVSRDMLLEKVEHLIMRFESLVRTFDGGKIIREGINLAIVGKPNVGKSSIFNYLLNDNRAIVSNIPGTTRDFLQEPLIMGGLQFNLIDTAGIRKTIDHVEKEGVRRSQLKIDESDIVLEVEDLSNPMLKADEFVIGVPEAKIIRVYNKCDISETNGRVGIHVSALTGENMHELQNSIIEKATSLVREIDTSEIVVTNQRHHDCLLKSCEYLVNAKNQITSGGGNELISYEIRAAMEALGEITGKITNVDILNNIFAKFCIGK